MATEHYLLALVVAGGLVAALWFRRHLVPSVEPRDAVESAAADRQPSDGQSAELFRFRVEMHGMARDLKGELDTKIAVLQQLVVMAKQESARMEELLKQARAREASQSARAA